jgi:anti-sigma B factor antagonist
MSQSFDITLHEKCAVIHLSDSILSDIGIAETLFKVDQHISEGVHNWILDGASLAYCNSIGLNLFIRVLTKARNKGGECCVAGIQPTVQKLMNLSKLNEIFTSFASVTDAVASFNK